MENNNNFLQEKLRVFVAPTDILDVKGDELDIYEKMVYIVLRSFCNGHDNAIAFPSYKTIAKLGSMSRAKAITVVESLLQKGLLTKEVRLDVSKNRKIRNTTNLYTLETPVVEGSYGLDGKRNYGEGSLRNRPPLVHSIDYPQSTAWTTPSPQRRPEKTINKKQIRKNKLENNNIDNTQTETVKSKQEVKNDVVVNLLSNHGLKANKTILKKWRGLALNDEIIIEAISVAMSKDEVENKMGYVTRMLEAGFTPSVKKKVDNKNNLPEWVSKQEQNKKSNPSVTPINIEQQKEALELLFKLGEINQEQYDEQLQLLSKR